MWGKKARVYGGSLGEKKTVTIELRITTPG
jgi:hypothetical protein